MKDVDLEEPTSFFDHVFLACTHRECQFSMDIADNYCSKSSSGQGMGKIGENFGVEPDKSQK